MESSAQPISSRSSTFPTHIRRKRYVLYGLAFVMIIGMVIGIIFVANSAYHRWGGQGFLGGIELVSTAANETQPNSFLPTTSAGHVVDDGALRQRRSPKNVPFKACGDQANGCESFGQPV